MLRCGYAGGVASENGPLTYDELLRLARAANGRTLKTVTGREFTVGVALDCPFFTPKSSGWGQSDGRKAAERFVEWFNETGSLRPGDYSKATRNASYYIGLLRWADTSSARRSGRR